MSQRRFGPPQHVRDSWVGGTYFHQDWLIPTASIDADGFAELTSGAGSDVLITDNRDGGDKHLVVAANDAEAYTFTPENYRFAVEPTGASNGLPFGAACSVDLGALANESNTFVFGFMQNVALESILPSGGGPETGVAQAVIWKLAGETQWHCGASDVNDLNPNHLSDQLAGQNNPNTASYQSLMIDVIPRGRELHVTYSFDPFGFGGFEPLTESGGTRPNQIITDVIRSPVTNQDMSIFIGTRQFGLSAYTVLIDWASGWMGRNRMTQT